MNEIIRALSAKLKLPEPVIAAGITVLLNFIKEKAKGSQYEQFVNLIPGAAQQAAAPLPTGGGGLLGGLLGAAGSMIGGQAGDVARAVSGLQSAGIQPDQIAPFVESFFQEAKQSTSPEQVEALLGQLPVLKDLLKAA